MKKILLLAVLLSLGSRADTFVQFPDLTTAATTINGVCGSPTAGCAAGQWAKIKLKGRTAVNAQVVTANFSGTFQAYYSIDQGTTWFGPGLVRNGISTPGGAATSVVLAASTATAQYGIVIPYGNVTDVALVSTAAVTNTATVLLTATASNPNPIPAVFTLKNFQPTVVLGTQDLKDSGRSFVVLSADGVTPAIADTLITFSKDVAGTVTGAQTTYAITSGKTLRIQSICASFTAGAAANIARVRLRLNTGGACLVGSSLVLPALELAPQYGTAAASEGWASGCIAVPEGLELSGASWNICISESAVAASGTLTVNLIGYEY